MKLNQQVLVTTSYNSQRSCAVRPRSQHVELYTGPEQDYVHGGKEPERIDADAAITLGTALINAGTETRKAIETDELDRRQRETAQALPAHFKGLREALQAYLDTQKIAIFRDEAKDALSLVDRAYRLMAQNESGTAKGTGYYLSAKDQMTDQLAEPAEKTYTLDDAITKLHRAGFLDAEKIRQGISDKGEANELTVEQLHVAAEAVPHWTTWVVGRKRQLVSIADARAKVLDAHRSLTEAQAVGIQVEIDAAMKRLEKAREYLNRHTAKRNNS